MFSLYNNTNTIVSNVTIHRASSTRSTTRTLYSYYMNESIVNLTIDKPIPLILINTGKVSCALSN